MRVINVLFDLDLMLAKPKGPNNPFQYYPEHYAQDPKMSIVSEDGRYDFDKFSRHEESVIRSVLLNVSKKYPKEFLSIGLVNESYVVVYKPRYILFELAIIKYEKSVLPIDQIAVAYAYAMKGARFRNLSIDFFEKSINKVSFSVLDKFASVNSSFAYMKLSELYEREWNYEKSIFWLRKSMKRGGLNNRHLQERVNDINTKIEKLAAGKLKKRTAKKPSEKDIEFDCAVHNAAIRFLY